MDKAGEVRQADNERASSGNGIELNSAINVDELGSANIDQASQGHAGAGHHTSPPRGGEERGEGRLEGEDGEGGKEKGPGGVGEGTPEGIPVANGTQQRPPGTTSQQNQPQQQQPAEELGEMPRAIVRRIVKAKLGEIHLQGKKRAREGQVGESGDKEGGEGSREIQVSKDALLAFSESAKIFVHYITALAHDWSQQAKRQTVTAEDVLRGLEDAQFFEFIDPLQALLHEMRTAKKLKRVQKSDPGKDAGTEAIPAAPMPKG